MKAEKYLLELASQLGLEYTKKRKPFAAEALITVNYIGTIMGARKGYVLALSLLTVGNSSQLAILLRFPEIADTKPLEEALKQAVGVKKLVVSKSAKAKNNQAEIRWTYALKKPSIEDVVPIVDEALLAVALHATPFDGKCEDCHRTGTSEITLFNDVPGYHCADCQMRVAGDRQRAAEEYANKPMDFWGGYLWASFAALGCAVAMAVLYYLLDDNGQLPLKLWFVLPCATGLGVGVAFAKKVGRIDLIKQSVPLFVLVLLASWAADTGYITMYVYNAKHIAITQDVVMRLSKFMWNYRLHGEGLVVLAGQICGGVISVMTVKNLRPKFDSVFVPLPVAAGKSFAVGA